VLKSEAERGGGPAVVFTFDRHPLELLAPERAPRYISTLEQRLKLIQDSGVDLVVLARFDHELADLSPEEFVDSILVSKLKAAEVVVGADFRFGRKRSGDVALLRVLAQARGIRAVSVDPVIAGGSKISSTRVRNAIERGDVETAARMLGRPFTMLGKVVSGQGLGRKLGFPTANLDVADRQVVPADGVYAVWVHIEEKKMMGACNIGVRPTLGSCPHTVEVHIDGFKGSLLGAEIAVSFVCRLRDEMKFENLEMLTRQISDDLQAARRCLGSAQPDLAHQA
jgi:riboflavin kinase/FMN adenylyltransferase